MSGDWSSDVCSSDLFIPHLQVTPLVLLGGLSILVTRCERLGQQFIGSSGRSLSYGIRYLGWSLRVCFVDLLVLFGRIPLFQQRLFLVSAFGTEERKRNRTGRAFYSESDSAARHKNLAFSCRRSISSCTRISTPIWVLFVFTVAYNYKHLYRTIFKRQNKNSRRFGGCWALPPRHNFSRFSAVTTLRVWVPIQLHIEIGLLQKLRTV